MTDTNTNQSRESHEKWEPIAGIETPAASAVVIGDQQGLKVTLLFSDINNGADSDLRIDFGRVPTYTVHEELLHPWQPVDPGPRLAGRWESYIYPLLLVKDSQWMTSLPVLSTNDPKCVHYRLVTLDQVVDVLSSKTPTVVWVRPSSFYDTGISSPWKPKALTTAWSLGSSTSNSCSVCWLRRYA